MMHTFQHRQGSWAQVQGLHTHRLPGNQQAWKSGEKLEQAGWGRCWGASFVLEGWGNRLSFGRHFSM